MGYLTSFVGTFRLNRKLTPEHAAYLREFARTRRMTRNEFIAERLPDPVRRAVGLPVGQDGCFYVGSPGFGEGNDESVVNRAPSAGQPSEWCEWVPTADGFGVEWNHTPKFLNYVEWLEYLIANFLIPWKYQLNGQVTWKGDRSADVGVISIVDNIVSTNKGFVLDHKGWAEFIAAKLSDDELKQFTLLLDGDRDDDFYYHLNEVNAARNPAEYDRYVKAALEPLPESGVVEKTEKVILR